PLPDENGQNGANLIFGLARNAGKGDLVLCLISGGGSALLPLPVPGLTMTVYQRKFRKPRLKTRVYHLRR
ncbi:MAG: DUF4147 domain-containing protein, partial [Pseudomonadota bacterium]